jgi:L-alanine-DL-glutamate epimerase-like enolase superfamily enzyme
LHRKKHFCWFSRGKVAAPLRGETNIAAHPDWPIYKIKLTKSTDAREVVSTIRSRTDARLMVDANCAWTPENCLVNIRAIEDLGVMAIEQPLPPDDLDAMKVLRDLSPIPLIADESCQVEGDVAQCAGAFHGINIKLQKCGGLTPALRMIAAARDAGMLAMIGCMGGETSIGISHAAQLLSRVDFADIDGAVLLRNDPAEGAIIENGYCRFSDLPGCGARLRQTMKTQLVS